MEKPEFVDLLSQMSLYREYGSRLRLSLIRTLENFFPKKISDEMFLDLRSLPFRDNYRFVLSSFGNSDYKKFRSAFKGDIQFLSFGYNELDAIVATANSENFYLKQFRSSGGGSITLKATADITGQNYLLNEMKNGIINEIYPVEYHFSNGKETFELDRNFNIILHDPAHVPAGLIYELTDKILSESSSLHERLMQQIYLRPTEKFGLPALTPIVFRIRPHIGDENAFRAITKGFLSGSPEDTLSGRSIYIFENSYSSPICRITLRMDLISLIALPGCSLDSILMVVGNISSIAKVVENGS